jgi:HSP20 family molecular chaperone IbpA
VPGLARSSQPSPLAPPVDIEETDDAYIVDIDLPNVNPEDVTLEMRGEELRISGEHPQRDRSGVVRRQNRPMGDFEYVVDLPSDIDPNRVEATYENGVLRITVGKTQEAQPRRIEIRASGGQQRIGQARDSRPPSPARRAWDSRAPRSRARNARGSRPEPGRFGGGAAGVAARLRATAGPELSTAHARARYRNTHRDS